MAANLTIQEVAKWCEENGYVLNDKGPQMQFNLAYNATAPITNLETYTFYSCTCGWHSRRHGCPLHA